MKTPGRPPHISGKYNYRSILDELAENGLFQRFLDLNDNKYPYWDKWKYAAKDWGMEDKRLWTAVKSLRVSNKRIRFSKLEGFMFQLGTPSVVQQYLHDFDLALRGETIISTEDRARYLASSLMEEAIASSQLEGSVTTRKVAKEMLENNRKPRNISEQMILNNYEAMKWILANKDEAFTPASIRSLHAIITHDTLPQAEEEGAFRKDNEVNVVDVQTGRTVYTPPAYPLLEQLMEDLCRFANDQDKQAFFIHPIVKGIFLHFMLGFIHPFSDGNGRTARTVFYWYLVRKGYWLIEYMPLSRIILHSKAQYAKAYLHTETDDNDLTYFVLYNLKSMAAALEDLKKYLSRKAEEKKNALVLLRETTFNERQILIVQELIQDQDVFFSVQQIQNRYGVSNQTARPDLMGLVEQGLMGTRTQGKRNVFFPVRDFLVKIRKEFSH
ncbi:Fic family protein [Chitinophaga sp. GCM10012297]|uniref:Fic family protein n=1 Tax=Chitinophaga chungangae TaxID=2821488 RepID=A0ABS3YHU9_9BACT|nr:Fic family protein [Chitinophaga chungangae]MBO9154275.1 Fic family protein [Chitinophaga chungangae]